MFPWVTIFGESQVNGTAGATVGQRRKRSVRYVTDNGEPLPTNMTASLLKGSHMNYELACQPIPSAEVPGYRFTCDHNGRTIARCLTCRVGFLVSETNGEAVRHAMAMHRDLSHGCGAR